MRRFFGVAGVQWRLTMPKWRVRIGPTALHLRGVIGGLIDVPIRPKTFFSAVHCVR
jgi:hypothetical protein